MSYTRNTHVKYESPTSYGSNVMSKVKMSKCRSKVSVKVEIMRSKFGTDGKVLSQGIHLWNIQALLLMV